MALKNMKTPEKTAARSAHKRETTRLKEHIVEIISDSGEGAQRCGQSLGSIAARMGNGVWTVEIIPAEIRPPARSVAGASGNRIRIGAGPVTNGGDYTDLVIAFNEQVLLGRVRAGELKPGEIDEQTISEHLYLPDVPDPELMIRTSGELRLSNFLLWQLSYSEFYITDAYWPDFREEQFFQALQAFNQRDRRYGKVNEKGDDRHG